MTRAYLTALLSVRTIAGIAVATVYGIFYVHSVAVVPETNAWDAIVPTFTETATISQIGLLWWALALLPLIRAYGRIEVMLRHGSPVAAVTASMKNLTAGLLAGGSGLILVGVVIAVAFPPALNWSRPSAIAATSTAQLSAFSAANLARFFSSPPLAMATCAVFTAVAFLVIAFVVTAAAARFGGRVAVSVLVTFYLWAALCSFGVANVIPAADVSGLLSLPWALSTGGLPAAVGVLAAMTACGILMLTLRRAHIRAWVTTRTPVTASLLAAVALTAWNADAQGHTPSVTVQVFFAGQYGDLLEYALIAFVALGYATGYAARLSEHTNDRFYTEALRYGSYRRWATRSLTAEILPLVTFLSATLLLLCAFITATDGLGVLASGELWVLLLHGTVGLGLEIAFLIVLAMLLFWASGSLTLWPAIAGACLVLGYPIIGDLGPANIFAPYSLPQDHTTPLSTAPLIAVTIATLCVLLLALSRASSRRGITLHTI